MIRRSYAMCDIDIDYDSEHSTATDHEPSSEKSNELAALASRAIHAMNEYAQQHSVSVEGVRGDVTVGENRPSRLVITVPKYISQEHRDAMEEIAFKTAASSHLRPEVQFVYEQSAG
jgi:hypothetical protein